KQNVGPTGAAADGEVADADVPLRETLGNHGAHSLLLDGGKTRRLSVGRVDHVPAADRDLIEARRGVRQFSEPLREQFSDRLNGLGPVAKELKELHLLEHRANVEPGEARV